jgi:3-oxoadipate enol-lactonase
MPLLHSHVPSSPRLAVTHAPAAGRNNGAAILFLHGIGANRSHWDDQLAFFASQGYTAIAPDLRGYGDSDDYDGPLDFIRDFADDAVRTLDHFGIQQAHIAGLSMGGRVARWFWLQHPQRVLSLTLANTQPGFDALGEEATEAFVSARLGPLMAGHDPADIATDLARGLIGPAAAPGAYDKLLSAMTRLHRTSYMKTVRASVEQDRGFVLDAIDVPTLVIAGSEDTLYPPTLAASMAGRIDNSVLKVLPHAGHLSNIEQPDAFNQALLGFLNDLD